MSEGRGCVPVLGMWQGNGGKSKSCSDCVGLCLSPCLVSQINMRIGFYRGPATKVFFSIYRSITVI